MRSNPVRDLGLMGGMFDPVHNGHLQIARDVLDHLALDEVHLLPCGNPVHRDAVVAPSTQRLAMLELALAGDEHIRVDARECRSPEPSYTYNSLLAIRREHPEYRLFYIMGQDAFNAFDTWYHWQDIFTLAHIVVAARPGYRPALSGKLAAEFARRRVDTAAGMKAHACGNILVASLAQLDISSSSVREKIMNHEPVTELLPSSVAAYIQANGLYIAEEQR